MFLSEVVSRTAKTLQGFMKQQGLDVPEQWCQETAKHMLGLKSWNLPTRPVPATAASILLHSAKQIGVTLTLAQAKEAVTLIGRFEKDPATGPTQGEKEESTTPTPDGL